MMHEVLLALSGHPSPLFEGQASIVSDQETFPLLSPSEAALLRSLSRLSSVHCKLKRHLDFILSSHPSIICRAVATSILHIQLARFQRRILEVEGKILRKDPALVGAYDTVPLAAIVGEFDDWHRRIAWFWEIACFIHLPQEGNRNLSPNTIATCRSASLIDRLRTETQTGFSEIEAAATELVIAAENAWLRLLSSWVVYGKLPTSGAEDFFIQLDDSVSQVFRKDSALQPVFVTPTTAKSILFIGKSLHQMNSHSRAKKSSLEARYSGLEDSSITSSHLSMLSALNLPISPSQFSKTISGIRHSLSRNLLQYLLPQSLTLRTLACLRQYFLLDRAGFAAALINEAEARVKSRQLALGRLLQQDPVKTLQSLQVKDGELHQALQSVWRTMLADFAGVVDETMEHAQAHVSFSVPKTSTSRPSTSNSQKAALPALTSVAFNDMLFQSPAEMNLTFAPPLDLFLSLHDVQIYTTINSYLLAVRRSHKRANDVWRLSSARREYQDREPRQRDRSRVLASRKVWATLSAATLLLSETYAFFEAEVIKGSCDHFLRWVEQSHTSSNHNISASDAAVEVGVAQRDPETLAAAHRSFLASLTYALLLTDVTYTKELRSLLGNIDNLIAFFTRTLDIQRMIETEQRRGTAESAYFAAEEQRIFLELDRSRKRVDGDMKSVVRRLRQLDHERTGSLRYLDTGSDESSDYEVWKGGGVDRLLMKLEFGRMIGGSD